MTENSSEILRIISDNVFMNNSSYKSRIHIYPNISSKMIQNAFRGFKLPIIYDEILAIFDLSLLSNCKSGVIFLENGFFATRTLASTYYVNYRDIIKCEISNNNLIIMMSNGEKLDVCWDKEQAEYLGNVLVILSEKEKKWNVVNSIRNTEAIKSVKELLSKNDLKKCQFCIHGAATACAGIGATPHIPMSDSLLITPIQISMIIALGQIFNEKISKSTAQSIFFGLSSSFVGRNIASLMVGWIPGVGNVINSATAVSMTEMIGWSFVQYISENKEFFIRKNIYEGVNYFQELIKGLTEKSFLRFANDLRFVQGDVLDTDRDKSTDVFFEIVAQYAFSQKISINEVFSVYANYLKKILRSFENEIVNNSQADRYYHKFLEMEFSDNNITVASLTDFVEIFLGLFNAIISNNNINGISKFQFDIESEDPNKFFYLLYINKAKDREKAIKTLKNNSDFVDQTTNCDKSKNTEKNMIKKKTIHIITSLLYCYVLEQGDQL